MPELPTEREIHDLLAKLDGLSLTAAQRALLTAILQVASDIIERIVVSDSSDVDKAFMKSFTPDKAKLLVDYAAGRPDRKSRRVSPAMITRSGGGRGRDDDDDD